MFFLISEETQTNIIYQKKRTTLRKTIIMIKEQDEKKFALTDVAPIAYKTARTFCTKQFLVLSQTILQSAENGFRTCRHPFYGLCCTKHPAPPPTSSFSPGKVRILQTTSVPTF